MAVFPDKTTHIAAIRTICAMHNSAANLRRCNNVTFGLFRIQHRHFRSLAAALVCYPTARWPA
jgi:hypothetical protein